MLSPEQRARHIRSISGLPDTIRGCARIGATLRMTGLPLSASSVAGEPITEFDQSRGEMLNAIEDGLELLLEIRQTVVTHELVRVRAALETCRHCCSMCLAANLQLEALDLGFHCEAMKRLGIRPGGSDYRYQLGSDGDIHGH